MPHYMASDGAIGFARAQQFEARANPCLMDGHRFRSQPSGQVPAHAASTIVNISASSGCPVSPQTLRISETIKNLDFSNSVCSRNESRFSWLRYVSIFSTSAIWNGSPVRSFSANSRERAFQSPQNGSKSATRASRPACEHCSGHMSGRMPIDLAFFSGTNIVELSCCTRSV